MYELVWAKPLTKVGEELQVSSAHIAQVCDAMGVPRPRPGYWNKLKVGRAPKQEPLPAPDTATLLQWSKSDRLPHKPRVKRQKKKTNSEKLAVAGKRVHFLVRGAKEHFLNSRPLDESGYLKPFKKLLVDVATSPTGLEKGLDLANELLMAFEAAGHHVSISQASSNYRRASIDERLVRKTERKAYRLYGPWSPMRPTIVSLGRISFGISIIEMTEETLLRYVRGDYYPESEIQKLRLRPGALTHTWTTTKSQPCGRLRLTIYSPYGHVDWRMEWEERGDEPLAAKAASIVKQVKGKVRTVIAMREEADRQEEIERKKREEEWQRYLRRDDQRRIEQSIKESREELTEVIQKWTEIVSVERFFAAAEDRAKALNGDERLIIEERLQLARDLMGTQDPLDFLRAWQSPRERYQPQYEEEDT
ncbi:MAG: hypothetical protein AAGA50_30000 [Pseudomonadota bacterium]